MDREDLPKAFVAHVRAHNQSVVWAICVSIVGTLLIWPAMYFLSLTVSLVGLSIAVGPYAQLPEQFLTYFVLGALASFPVCLSISWFLEHYKGHWLYQHLFLKWFLELLVAPHRITLSVFGHFRAFCFLGRRDQKLLVKLLRIIDEQRRLEVRRVEVEVPQFRRRQKLLEALSLMELTTLTRLDDRLYLTLHDLEVRKILYPRVKLKPRLDANDRMPREKPRKR